MRLAYRMDELVARAARRLGLHRCAGCARYHGGRCLKARSPYGHYYQVSPLGCCDEWERVEDERRADP
jgi:hypothetical protein